jgi:hypothetical protein
VVHVEVDARDVVERALVVLGFESKVPLDEDEEPARLAARVEPDPRDVLDDRLELALRVCFFVLGGFFVVWGQG